MMSRLRVWSRDQSSVKAVSWEVIIHSAATTASLWNFDCVRCIHFMKLRLVVSPCLIFCVARAIICIYGNDGDIGIYILFNEHFAR